MESAGLLRSRVRRRIMWLGAAAAGLSLALAATALAAPDRAAAFLGRPQRGVAAALAQEARQVLERTHPPSAPGEGHNHSEEWHNAFAEVAIALALTGQQDAARRLIEDAGEHSDQLIPLSAQVAAALVLAGRVPEAKQAMAESVKEIEAEHLIQIAVWLVTDGRTPEAEKLSRALLSGETLDKAFATITRALADKGQITEGRRLAARIDSNGQRAVAFAALASASAALGRSADAQIFIKEATERSELVGDPDVDAALVQALASLRGAREVMDRVRRISEPQQRHAALLAAFAKFMERGKTADAEALERHARELVSGASSDEEVSSCDSAADPSAYGHALAGRFSEAMKTAALISEPWMRAATFACVSVVFADAGRPEESRLAVRQALAAAEAIIPSGPAVDDGCGEGGPVSYDYLVEAIVKAEDIDEVRRIAATFPNGTHREFMLALAAAALWRTGETREAEQVADAAWTAYRDGPSRSDMAEEAIVWILAESGMARKAAEIMRVVARRDLAPFFAYSLRYMGRFRDAYDFEHYAGVHDKFSDPEPAVFALLRTGRLSQAVSHARQVDDSPLKAKVLARAAIRYMRAIPIHSPN